MREGGGESEESGEEEGYEDEGDRAREVVEVERVKGRSEADYLYAFGHATH